MCKVRKSLRGRVAAERGITRIRIGALGRRTSTRRTRISRRRRGMSQGQTTEPVALPAARASDGMFRPGRTQRETLLTVLRLAAGYEQWVTLQELAGKTKFPPASISAQLRHLRKALYGGWVGGEGEGGYAEEEGVGGDRFGTRRR